MHIQQLSIVTLLLFVVGMAGMLVPFSALAHRSGCHNLHSCPSDSGTYVCGDLGYPCDGSTSIKQIAPGNINVPLLVERLFVDTFGRVPSTAESRFWKARFRADKDGLVKLRRAMAWHYSVGSFGPKPTAVDGRHDLAPKINALFRSVYDGRNPTASENRYWLGRLKDKPSETALRGAMQWHREHNMLH